MGLKGTRSAEQTTEHRVWVRGVLRDKWLSGDHGGQTGKTPGHKGSSPVPLDETDERLCVNQVLWGSRSQPWSLSDAGRPPCHSSDRRGHE